MALDEAVFPGAVLLVRLRGSIVYHHAFGLAASIPDPQPASLHTVYDLASLTKPLATVGAILCLTQDGLLDLDRSAQHVLRELKGSAIGQTPLRRLLTHSSGLPAWRPFFESIAARDRECAGFLGSEHAKRLVLQMIRDECLSASTADKSVYSDLGFILLGFVVEHIAGCPLSAYCRARLYDQIGVDELFFIGPGGEQQGRAGKEAIDPRRIAPTEKDSWRGRVIHAEVHDENAYAIGGVAGHAGLFGTAEAVSQVSSAWLNAYVGKPSALPAGLVRSFLRREQNVQGSNWAMGWDSPTVPSSSGTYFSSQSFGHLGFTGTSIWVDPTVELEVILLSNRVHPTRQNDAIRGFRPRIHDLVYCTYVGEKDRRTGGRA